MDFYFLLLVGIGFFIVLFLRSIFNRNKAYQLQVKGILALQQEVRSLLREKSVTHFIIEFNNYFIQYSKLPDATDIYCNAVSNEFLSEEHDLSEDKHALMKDYGFYIPGEKDDEGNSSQNFFAFYSRQSEDHINVLLETLEKIMRDVYGYELNSIVLIKVNTR